MKRLLAAGLCLFALACGGNSPAAPSAPPTPVYPNLVAAWAGTATIGVVTVGQNASNICQSTWIVASQTADTISGTFQLTGGTVVACGQSGTFSGTVTTAGAVTIAFNPPPPPAGCSVVSGTPLTGVATSTTLTLQQTVHLTCTGSAVDQTVTLALTKR